MPTMVSQKGRSMGERRNPAEQYCSGCHTEAGTEDIFCIGCGDRLRCNVCLATVGHITERDRKSLGLHCRNNTCPTHGSILSLKAQ